MLPGYSGLKGFTRWRSRRGNARWPRSRSRQVQRPALRRLLRWRWRWLGRRFLGQLGQELLEVLAVRSGQLLQAPADLRRAIDLWANDPERTPEQRFERARTLALLAGLGEKAKSGVTAAEAATFGEHAMAALRDAFSSGWGWPDELKEPDFDALRGRADFQRLLAEVQAKAGPHPKPKD
jgi:hypothetical protein